MCERARLRDRERARQRERERGLSSCRERDQCKPQLSEQNKGETKENDEGHEKGSESVALGGKHKRKAKIQRVSQKDPHKLYSWWTVTENERLYISEVSYQQ